jgi:hypothetical protein
LSEHPDVTVSQIPPNLLLCLYFASWSITGLEVLAARLPAAAGVPRRAERERELDVEPGAGILTKCRLHPKIVGILCQFLVRLTARCSAAETAACRTTSRRTSLFSANSSHHT